MRAPANPVRRDQRALGACLVCGALLAGAGASHAAPPAPSNALAAEGAETTAEGSAATQGTETRPYQPWQGSEHSAPPLVGDTPPPPISVESPQFFRRPVELIPSLGMTLPVCKSGNRSDDRCDGVGVGGSVGFSAFWRVTPYFAWGGGLGVAGFGYDPPKRLRVENARAGAVWIGLLGRVYFLDEGTLDPYLQLGVGLGALGTKGDDATGVSYEETGAGPSAEIGAGIDFFLNRGLRLGPRFSYTRVFVDKIRRCIADGDGACVDVSKNQDGHLNSYLTLSVGLTVMLGEEL